MQKILSIALIFIGLTMAVLAGPPEIQTLAIAMEADDYAETTAEVTNVRTRRHPRGPSTEVVEFDYEVAGKTYHGDNHLTQFDDSRADIERRIHTQGERRLVEVYYDPDHPGRVLLHRDIGLWVPVGILAGTLACLWFGGRGYLEDRRRRQRGERMRS